MSLTAMTDNALKRTDRAERIDNTDLRATYPDLLSTNQAAEILNVTPRTVTRMCEQGKLKAVRVMSLWRINRDRLLDFAGLN